MDILLYILFLFIGGIIAFIFQKGKIDSNESQIKILQNSNEKISNKNEQLQEQNINLTSQLASKTSDLENLKLNFKEKEGTIIDLQKKFSDEFKVLANKILEDKSDKFTNLNKRNISGILEPLEKKIEAFENKIIESQKENVGLHSSLKTQLEALKTMNLQMSKDATNLTKALKGDSQIRGSWGETVLENVLEKSGLVKDIDYYTQKSFSQDSNSRLIPDVIVNLPDGKKMIIDSKVSLVDYEKFSSAENPDDQKIFLKKHIESLKNHIKSLSSKRYQDLYDESPDFVLMFVPIEPALYFAQNYDRDFYYSAFKDNILLVSPTTLLSTLKTIDNLWKNERQQQNAREIAHHAASLYTKFNNLLMDLEKVGTRLKSTETVYVDAMKKLTGKQNLIKDIDKLEKLGVSPKKKIEKKWIDRASN